VKVGQDKDFEQVFMCLNVLLLQLQYLHYYVCTEGLNL